MFNLRFLETESLKKTQHSQSDNFLISDMILILQSIENVLKAYRLK